MAVGFWRFGLSSDQLMMLTSKVSLQVSFLHIVFGRTHFANVFLFLHSLGFHLMCYVFGQNAFLTFAFVCGFYLHGICIGFASMSGLFPTGFSKG